MTVEEYRNKALVYVYMYGDLPTVRDLLEILTAW